MTTFTCVFCQIVSDQLKAVPNEMLQPDVVSFTPLNPVVPGHRLFVPVQHVDDATENPRISGKTMEAATGWARFSSVSPNWNFITSVGEAATQSVFHLHIHAVPRYPGDGLHLPWTGQVK